MWLFVVGWYDLDCTTRLQKLSRPITRYEFEFN